MKKFLKNIYHIIPFKKQAFLALRQIWKPKNYIYKHLHFKGVISVPINDNYSFKVNHYGYQVENDIFWEGLTGGWEKISLKLWIELSKNSNTILDIGANTGIYSLVAKTINPHASVHGFEPVERVFKKYKRNCELNNYDINCLEVALSNFDGEGVIYDTNSEHTYSVTVNKDTTSDKTIAIETKILTKKLSTFILDNNIKKIDLMKIDVETHEPEVLEGMGEFLKQFQPTMLIEILNDAIGKKVQLLIKDIDYLFFNIDEINKPQRVLEITKSGHYNYLICKEDIAKELNLI